MTRAALRSKRCGQRTCIAYSYLPRCHWFSSLMTCCLLPLFAMDPETPGSSPMWWTGGPDLSVGVDDIRVRDNHSCNNGDVLFCIDHDRFDSLATPKPRSREHAQYLMLARTIRAARSKTVPLVHHHVEISTMRADIGIGSRPLSQAKCRSTRCSELSETEVARQSMVVSPI